MLDKTAATNINLAPNRRHLPASLWTDERVECLKKLWADGLSCKQIAGQLDCGASRNAVIGKISRLGLSGRVRAKSSNPRKARSVAAGHSNTARRIAKTPKVRSPSNGGVRIERSIVREEAPPRADFLGIALLDLEPAHCRFPKGEGASISFCGQKALSGESWCVGHYPIVFQPPRPRVERAYLPTGGSKPAVF